MSTPSNSGSKSTVPWYGTANNWSEIIKGSGEAATSALKSAAEYGGTKREARETKRRTLANLLNQALKREQGLQRVGQEYSDEMADYQSQALQQMARGFIQSLQGNRGV